MMRHEYVCIVGHADCAILPRGECTDIPDPDVWVGHPENFPEVLTGDDESVTMGSENNGETQ